MKPKALNELTQRVAHANGLIDLWPAKTRRRQLRAILRAPLKIELRETQLVRS